MLALYSASRLDWLVLIRLLAGATVYAQAVQSPAEPHWLYDIGQLCWDEELCALGEELSGRVVQKYIHQRLLDEMRARQFVVVEEETDENNAIRLRVRHWDG